MINQDFFICSLLTPEEKEYKAFEANSSVD